jgi:hypothetical protein
VVGVLCAALVLLALLVVERTGRQMIPLAHTSVLVRYDDVNQCFSAIQPLFEDTATTTESVHVPASFARVTVHQHHQSNAGRALSGAGAPGVVNNYSANEQVVSKAHYAQCVGSPGQSAFIQIQLKELRNKFDLIATCGPFKIRSRSDPVSV